jgi:hypothetical protein
MAQRKGTLSVRYIIESATPGFKVKVPVTVKKGSRTGSRPTSFTPRW